MTYLNLLSLIYLEVEIFPPYFKDFISSKSCFSSYSSGFLKILFTISPIFSFAFSHFLKNNSLFSFFPIYVKHISCSMQWPISLNILFVYLLGNSCSGLTNKWCKYMIGSPFNVRKILSKVKPPSNINPDSFILMDNYKSHSKHSHSSSTSMLFLCLIMSRRVKLKYSQ